MSKLISVVIPAYNAADTIISSIKSIEKLGYNNCFKVIIIDDGSIDDTYNKVIEYKKATDLDIVILRQENKGEGAARNAAIRLVQSEYIIFLDSDDEFEMFDFQKIKMILDNKKYDMILGGYKRVTLNKVENYKLSKTIVNKGDLIDGVCGRIIPAGIGNTFYRTSIIRENSIEFGAYKYGADMEFVRRYITKCQLAYISDDIIFKYNFNPESVMNQDFNLNRIDAIKSVLDTKAYYNSQHINIPDSLDVFLICEIRGMAQAYYRSCKKESFNIDTLYNVSLKYLPSKIATKKFIRKDRTLWLIMNLFFYHHPMIYLKLYNIFLKRFRN